MFKKDIGYTVALPFTSETVFYLEGGGDAVSLNHGCYTIISAAILNNHEEVALLLENDYLGEEKLAVAIVRCPCQLATLRRNEGKLIGAYKQEFAYFIRESRWWGACNDLGTELDDRCYENFILLTDEEIDKI